MLNIFLQQPQGLGRTTPGSPPKIPEEAIWLDLLEPTQDEEKLVERELGIEVPTREEMKEIETSNRLYEDNGALYMTTTVAAQLDTDRPVATAVTFILTGSRLVTNRYLDTKPFQQFIAYAEKTADKTSELFDWMRHVFVAFHDLEGRLLDGAAPQLRHSA